MQLNHTIIHCTHAQTSAQVLAEILGRPAPQHCGPFWVVETDNGVQIDYDEVHHAIEPQHYAFLITEPEFDQVLARVQAKALRIWADPMQSREGAFNRNDGGRAFYFEDPDRHLMEVLTVPYGGWKK